MVMLLIQKLKISVSGCRCCAFQPDHLVYIETNAEEAKRLQEKIEIDLKKKIADWRSRYVTRWNRYCITAFRRLLVGLARDLQSVLYKYFDNV